MHDPSTDLYGQGEGNAPESAKEQPSMSSYKFSTEELGVLRECNSESFYQRSLPIGTMLGLGTYGAIQSGKLRPNPRFGALPKVTLAVIVGYFIGKISYQEACAEKLMKLPGSYIGQLLREQREGRARTKMNPHQTHSPPTMFGAGPNDIYSDAGPESSLDLDTERPIFSGDDSYRPNNDTAPGSEPGVPKTSQGTSPVQSGLTYEELRRKNRGEYEGNRQDPYKLDPYNTPPIVRPRQPAPTPPTSTKTNKYGDAMD